MRTQLKTTAAAMLALALVASTAAAQDGARKRSGDRSNAGSSDSGSRARENPRENRGGSRESSGVAVRRSEPRSGSYGAGSSAGSSGGYSRRENGSQGSSNTPVYGSPSGNRERGAEESRGASGMNRNDNRAYEPRGGDRGAEVSRGASGMGRGDERRDSGARDGDRGRTDPRVTGRAVPRETYSRDGGYRDYGNRNDGRRDYGYRNRVYRGSDWRGSYDRNYWRGRVRFGLGISIFAGDPFRFHFDYGWRPGFDYRYSLRAGYAYGGMVFLVDPEWTEVYIDGDYVGIAGDWGGQPVPISAGYHRIELYADGFEPVAFDIHVRPGEVIPYRGTLYEYRRGW